MTWDTLLPLLRHLLQFAGGYLISMGFLDAAMTETLIGGLLSIGSVAWWFFTKKPVTP